MTKTMMTNVPADAAGGDDDVVVVAARGVVAVADQPCSSSQQ